MIVLNVQHDDTNIRVWTQHFQNQKGRTGNMIIKDLIRQMCVLLENSMYFDNADGINSNPEIYHSYVTVPDSQQGQRLLNLYIDLPAMNIFIWQNLMWLTSIFHFHISLVAAQLSCAANGQIWK